MRRADGRPRGDQVISKIAEGYTKPAVQAIKLARRLKTQHRLSYDEVYAAVAVPILAALDALYDRTSDRSPAA